MMSKNKWTTIDKIIADVRAKALAGADKHQVKLRHKSIKRQVKLRGKELRDAIAALEHAPQIKALLEQKLHELEQPRPHGPKDTLSA
jgi:hypothetical protein